jgi:hypothetical protein
MLYRITIDSDRRRVVTKWGMAVTDHALMAYQKSVWGDPAVRGFDELIDFRDLKEVAVSSDGLRAIAGVAAATDEPDVRSRFAIVVGSPSTFGLARMYETFRSLEERTTREVAVFDRLDAAVAWLDESR